VFVACQVTSIILIDQRFGRNSMASADLQGLVKDIFAELSADLHRKPYKPEDRDAEAAKIARLRQLRLATSAEAGGGVEVARKLTRGLIVAR